MIYRTAIPEDIEQLKELRANVLIISNELPPHTNMDAIKTATEAYHRRTIHSHEEHVTVVALPEEDGLLAGCGSICFYTLMPTYHNLSGKTAYMMNIYTKQEYRRQGIGREIVRQLLWHAKQRGCGRILLEATEEGRILYESCGFASAPHEMEFQFDH